MKISEIETTKSKTPAQLRIDALKKLLIKLAQLSEWRDSANA